MTALSTRDALDPLRHHITGSAISARARGAAEEERRWLDAQILLDRLPVIDAAALADESVIHVLRRVATNGKRKPETQAALLRLADALATALAERGEGR